MQNQPSESLNESYTTSMAIMRRLDKASARVWKELISEQLTMARLCMDYWNRQVEILLSRGTPATAIAAQSDLATEFSMKFRINAAIH